MSARNISYGKCFFCGKSYASSGMGRHLKACQARKEANQRESGRTYTMYHLRIWDPYAPLFWLHLEIPAKAQLADLDEILRDVWVECCGHLSQFIIRGTNYAPNPAMDREWGIISRSSRVPLEKVVSVGDTFQYEYDFGTTTELSIKVVDSREGKARNRKDFQFLARNYRPDFRCAKCGQPAQWIYTFEYPPVPLCEEHMETVEDEAGLLPLVNSPRTGMCGYTGPYDKNYEFEQVYVPPEK